MTQADLNHIRGGIAAGLPAGIDRFRNEIERARAVKPGTGPRGRPGRLPEQGKVSGPFIELKGLVCI
jgi:hypothetical protein